MPLRNPSRRWVKSRPPCHSLAHTVIPPSAHSCSPFCLVPPPRCAVQRIALVKPEKARAVEDQLLRAARMGQVIASASSGGELESLFAAALEAVRMALSSPAPPPLPSSQITERLSEERLISMLEKLNEGAQSGPKITIQRRRSALDDD